MIHNQTNSQETHPQDLLKDSNGLNKLPQTSPLDTSQKNQGKGEEDLTMRSKGKEEKKKEGQFLEFHPKSEQETVSFKKLKHLSKAQVKAYNMCYIPERNVLLVLRKDRQRVDIYSTIDFKLVSVVPRTDLTEIHVILYCSHLNKILVGGAQNLVEIWNPITFKTESRTYNEALDSTHYVQNLEYIPESNLICVATKIMLEVYDVNLLWMSQFKLPWKNGSWKDFSPEFFAISNDRLLMTCFSCERKFFVLINLKTKAIKEYNDFYIPYTSAIERTGPNRFLALVNDNLKKLYVYWKLFEMTFDLETEEFVLLKKLDNLLDFRRLVRIENSKYYVAKSRTKAREIGVCLLWINGSNIEMIQVILQDWSDWGKFVMMKDGLSVIQIDYKDDIIINHMMIQKEEEELVQS